MADARSGNHVNMPAARGYWRRTVLLLAAFLTTAALSGRRGEPSPAAPLLPE